NAKSAGGTPVASRGAGPTAVPGSWERGSALAVTPDASLVTTEARPALHGRHDRSRHAGCIVHRRSATGGRPPEHQPHRTRDVRRVTAAQDVAAALERLGALRDIASRDVGHAEDGALLLHGAAVGHDGPRLALEFHEVEEAEWFQQAHACGV